MSLSEPHYTAATVADRIAYRFPTNKGFVAIEFYYCYHQVLNLPIANWVVPDPLRIHAYTIMPLPAAQPTPTQKTRKNRGQIIVIFAVTLLALIFFAGLAIDAGSLYVTYGQMRRAIDAAAVAAANDYKSEGASVVAPPLSRMTKAAWKL